MTRKMFNVGKIINTHGIKGEVKVQRITDFKERFTVGNTLFLVDYDNNLQELTIASHRTHKHFDLLQFVGYDHIELVEPFKGAMLQISEKELFELPEDEFYYHDIIGCTVYTMDQEKIGVITDILSPGANDVWVVQMENNKEVYIPYIDDVVKEVDIILKKVIIEPMEGLID